MKERIEGIEWDWGEIELPTDPHIESCEPAAPMETAGASATDDVGAK